MRNYCIEVIVLEYIDKCASIDIVEVFVSDRITLASSHGHCVRERLHVRAKILRHCRHAHKFGLRDAVFMTRGPKSKRKERGNCSLQSQHLQTMYKRADEQRNIDQTPPSSQEGADASHLT